MPVAGAAATVWSHADRGTHRDHSWGARSWAATLHYKWANFLADDVLVHVMDLHGYGRTNVRGYVHQAGRTAETSWPADYAAANTAANPEERP